MRLKLALAMIVLAAAAAPAAIAKTVNCKNTGSFARWLDDFRREAATKGISRRTISAALDGMTLDPGVIARDRRQGFFAQSFLSFSGKLASKNRIYNGKRRLKQHAAVFARFERKYGVSPAVITAFWALESDFGVGMGKLPVLRSLATLAYDCRRGPMFREELLAALRIIDKGDLRPSDMIGSWAGELGQTQFLPTHYWNHAVDGDGDGRRNLMKSVPDIIASTANFISHLGWRRGEPWLQEVRIPQSLKWDQADLAIQHPRAQWAAWGVRRVDGRPLPNDRLAASLLLPMGRHGPAFLAYPNFQIYLKWNQSLNYAVTAAYLATRLDGAPAMSRGRDGLREFDQKSITELQRLLVRMGYDVGEVDGKMGALTRAAVKKAQIKFGLPADSYPTAELLERMRRRR
ncbi:MAG: lytic murein transglycosylase [Hyphomicrobiaceae bacterium]